jgi:hypothetical protein
MREARCEHDIGKRLLEYLRSTLGDATLDYAEPPARIVGGYDTAIYALRLTAAPGEFGRPLILRVFRDDTEAVRPRFERAVQMRSRPSASPAARAPGWRAHRRVRRGLPTHGAGAWRAHARKDVATRLPEWRVS